MKASSANITRAHHSFQALLTLVFELQDGPHIFMKCLATLGSFDLPPIGLVFGIYPFWGPIQDLEVSELQLLFLLQNLAWPQKANWCPWLIWCHVIHVEKPIIRYILQFLEYVIINIVGNIQNVRPKNVVAPNSMLVSTYIFSFQACHLLGLTGMEEYVAQKLKTFLCFSFRKP